jgi:hypothetical protein
MPPLSSRPKLVGYFQPSSHQPPLDPFPFLGHCSWFFIFVITFFFNCCFVNIFLSFVVQLLHFFLSCYPTTTLISITTTFFHLFFSCYISFIWCSTILPFFQQLVGKNTVKGTTMTKVGVLTKDCILHVSYMYWSIKYQNCILNVIFGTRY